MNILHKNLIPFLLLFANHLFSVSAPPQLFEVEQPDGRTIPVRMFGHEYYNWMETEDGYVIDFLDDETRKGWYYCDLNNNGKYFPTHRLVNYPASIDLNIPKKIR